MKIEHIEVYGFRAAIRGMRNPMNSWDRSDSGDTYSSYGTVSGTEIGQVDVQNYQLDLLKQVENIVNT